MMWQLKQKSCHWVLTRVPNVTSMANMIVKGCYGHTETASVQKTILLDFQEITMHLKV